MHQIPIQVASSSAKHKSEAKDIGGSSLPCSIGPPIAPSEGIATFSGTCGDHLPVKSILAIDASAANVQNSRAVESTLEVQQKSSQTCTASPRCTCRATAGQFLKDGRTRYGVARRRRGLPTKPSTIAHRRNPPELQTCP